MKLTSEQSQIVESDSAYLRVYAFAGAGKTSTCVAYGKARPRAKILYLAFNKSIQVEAQHKFSTTPNVKCMTSHGLAFPKFGSVYANAGKLVPSLKVNQVADVLGFGSIYPSEFKLYAADAVLKSVHRFLASDDSEFDEEAIANAAIPGSDIDPSEIAKHAQNLWAKMYNPNDASVGMLHDGYLKLYRMSNPKLFYDHILFDEAQDASPVTAALVENQKQSGIVVVGDNHQAIYSFRGATNAMKKFQAEQTLYLTRSFRFGPGVANVANSILHHFKNERKELVGLGEPSQIGAFPRAEPHTFIARANGTLFEEAVKLVRSGQTIGFVGGIAGYRMSEVLDVHNLWAGAKASIKSPYIRSFKNFETLSDYAVAADDKELKSLAKCVKTHSHHIPQLVQKIRASASEDSQKVDVWLSTTHKAKGLEWSRVRMGDDFMKCTENDKIRKIGFLEQEEANILYVTATRAKRFLAPSPELERMLSIEKNSKIQEKMPEWARPVRLGPGR